jgi:hypothetical protein
MRQEAALAGMIGIGGTARPASVAGPRGPRGAATFRLPPDATQAGTGAAATAAAAPLGLIALQEAEGAAARNRRGAARAQDLLRELSALQAEMLRGGADPERLSRLAELAEADSPADPVLADALAGIALRARIELARRGIMVAAK